MPQAKVKAINWLAEADEKDYPAAASYLSLLYSPDRVPRMVKRLRDAQIVQFKAKDIFRASELSLLGVSNSHVENDRLKIAKGRPLSPLLLVRNKVTGRLVIADGYHRLCAVYTFNEDIWICCKII